MLSLIKTHLSILSRSKLAIELQSYHQFKLDVSFNLCLYYNLFNFSDSPPENIKL